MRTVSDSVGGFGVLGADLDLPPAPKPLPHPPLLIGWVSLSEDREGMECRAKLPRKGVDHDLVPYLGIPAALGNAEIDHCRQAAQPRDRQGGEMSKQLRLGGDRQRRFQAAGGAQRVNAVGEAAGRQKKLLQHS